VREGEAQSVLAAHAMLCKRIPDALLILVPRHPERFVLPSLPAYGGADAVVYRTKASPITRATSILFADTMGELSVFLAAADIAFVGGSLVAVGGHNPLEPAALGLPVLMGPHVVNFAQVDRLLGEASARYRVVDARSLATTLENLLTDAPARQAAGVQAQAVVEQHRGACKKTLTQLTDRLGLITK
jgi:3-deoxy-D-manno-octulosonic-acid transferase